MKERIREREVKLIDPNFRPKRDQFGFLLTIQSGTEEVRKIWEYPSDNQDHVCALFGYCAFHKCEHVHPSRPRRSKSQTLGKKEGCTP